MQPNRTKARLQEGKPVIGTFAFLSDPAVIEVIALAGFDFVIIDTEHSSKDLSTVEHMVRAADAVGITPLVRVNEIDEKTILRALETGTQGIVVPFVRTAEDARCAHNAVRYPPTGSRGYCGVTRAARYGAVRQRMAEHIEDCNRELLLVGLIEDTAGVENIEAILDAGIEVAFVGRGDLSSVLGVPGQSEHPLVMNAVERVFAATRQRKDRWAGIVPYQPSEGARWMNQDCPFLCYGADMMVLMNALQAAASEFRKGLGAASA